MLRKYQNVYICQANIKKLSNYQISIFGNKINSKYKKLIKSITILLI